MKYLFVLLSVAVLFGCTKKIVKHPQIKELKKMIVEDVKKSDVVKKSLKLGVSKFNTETPKIIAPVRGVSINEMVYFELDSDNLTPGSKRTLFSLLGSLKGNEIIIKGFCCPIGTDDYNYRLGLRRASSVYKYFEKNCPNLKAVCASGGEYELINENPSEYYLNRRVEIKRGK